MSGILSKMRWLLQSPGSECRNMLRWAGLFLWSLPKREKANLLSSENNYE